jgi:hypothetical protein
LSNQTNRESSKGKYLPVHEQSNFHANKSERRPINNTVKTKSSTLVNAVKEHKSNKVISSNNLNINSEDEEDIYQHRNINDEIKQFNQLQEKKCGNTNLTSNYDTEPAFKTKGKLLYT